MTRTIAAKILPRIINVITVACGLWTASPAYSGTIYHAAAEVSGFNWAAHSQGALLAVASGSGDFGPIDSAFAIATGVSGTEVFHLGVGASSTALFERRQTSTTMQATAIWLDSITVHPLDFDSRPSSIRLHYEVHAALTIVGDGILRASIYTSNSSSLGYNYASLEMY